jgi:Sap, sulfolipid-1-addressing protein
MWSSVLGLALLAALHPVPLGLTLLMISRPRPVQNLLAYWVGSLTSCVPALLVPLIVVHSTRMFRFLAQGSATPAASSTVRHIQIGIGVVALSIAALMTVRFLARRRARLAAPENNTSTLVLDSDTPIAIGRLLNWKQDAATEGGSAIRRLLGRAHNAWENGSLWVAWVIGLGSVSADGVLFVAAIIVASGAAIGTQVSAAIAFLVVMYAVVEIIFVTYLAWPEKTQAVLQLLHDWARAHRRQVLIAIFAVVGVSQLTQGMGLV